MGADRAADARRIGSLRVSPIGLGTARVAIEGRPDWQTGVAVIVAAVEAGMTLIDTADAYCVSSKTEHGYGERLVAEALEMLGDRAAGVVVATKGGEVRDRGAWLLKGHPDHLRTACEESLRRLGVDVIDLYQLHRPDPTVPIAESVGAIAEMRRAGLVREIGVCNVTERELALALEVAPLASVQNRLSFDRSSENSIIATCEDLGLAYLAHSPFGGPGGARSLAGDRRLAGPAQARDVSSHDVALAALLARSASIIPIPGTSNPARPAQHLAARGIEFDDQERLLLGLPSE